MISGLVSPSSVRRCTYARVRGSDPMRVNTIRQSAWLAWRLPPRLSRQRVTLPEDAGTGATPHRCAHAASEPLPQLVRGGEAQMPDLVEHLDAHVASRALGHHQRSDRLHVSIRGLGDGASSTAERGAGRFDRVEGIRLALASAGLAVGT